MRMFFAALALLLTAGWAGADEAALKRRVAELEARLPPKHAVSLATSEGGASGTVVANEDGVCLVLTNRHVIDHDRRVFVIAAGKTYPAKFLAADPAADLAAVVVRADLPAAEVAPEEPPEGGFVRHFGRATGPQQGRVTGVTPFVTVPSLNTDMLNTLGDSGAGVFGRDGKLVAVVHGKMGSPEEFGEMLCVRLTHVRPFLKRVAPGQFPGLAAQLK